MNFIYISHTVGYDGMNDNCGVDNAFSMMLTRMLTTALLTSLILNL